jgi:hypothetical protein
MGVPLIRGLREEGEGKGDDLGEEEEEDEQLPPAAPLWSEGRTTHTSSSSDDADGDGDGDADGEETDALTAPPPDRAAASAA